MEAQLLPARLTDLLRYELTTTWNCACNMKLLKTAVKQSIVTRKLKGATSRFVHLEKFNLNFSSWSFAIRVNLSPSITILVTFWFILLILVFFYLTKQIFCGFLHVEGKFRTLQKKKKTQNIET